MWEGVDSVDRREYKEEVTRTTELVVGQTILWLLFYQCYSYQTNTAIKIKGDHSVLCLASTILTILSFFLLFIYPFFKVLMSKSSINK